MYFEFTDFYKRDVYFSFSEEKNIIDLYSLRNGQKLDENIPLIFEVDKIDSYINSYDVLPTYNAPLVSNKFKNIFDNLADDIQYIEAIIIDKKNNRNENFYYLNILNTLPIMDKNKSKIEYKKYGDAEIIVIKKLYITNGALKEHSIVRMEEQKSHIIVTEEFKNNYINAKLKGINFLEEGYSIYNE
jgi:hypothetical protein